MSRPPSSASTSDLILGSRVEVTAGPGILRWTGTNPAFAAGKWVGVELYVSSLFVPTSCRPTSGRASERGQDGKGDLLLTYDYAGAGPTTGVLSSLRLALSPMARTMEQFKASLTSPVDPCMVSWSDHRNAKSSDRRLQWVLDL